VVTYGCCGGYVAGTVSPPEKKKTALAPTQGAVVVHLPDDARLYVDGQPSSLTSPTRRIVTPDLVVGQDYVYTLKAEAVRNGQTVEQQKKIFVRAGREVEVDLRDLTARAESASPARVRVHLPAEARLYVDGVLCPLTSGMRAFDTPPLEDGRPYYYTLKAELVRDGERRAQSKHVEVRAGKVATVDFNDLGSVRTASR
jgi:uncharacterized protein (TIGR03000 family)